MAQAPDRRIRRRQFEACRLKPDESTFGTSLPRFYPRTKEGSVVMKVRGGKEITLTEGQTFFEGPDDIHVVGRNASKTQSAKFIAFFVKDKGASAVMPAE
jgi:hypothetical protein